MCKAFKTKKSRRGEKATPRNTVMDWLAALLACPVFLIYIIYIIDFIKMHERARGARERRRFKVKEGVAGRKRIYGVPSRLLTFPDFDTYADDDDVRWPPSRTKVDLFSFNSSSKTAKIK